MQQIKINKILINYVLLIFMSMGSLMSQQNEYESFIKKGNNSFEENTVLSEQNYRKAISVSPEFVKGQYNFSNNLYENEYYDEALLNQIEASKYAKTTVDKHQIFHNIGNILMKQEMCKEAVEAYKNALKNNPKDDESRYNLALAKDCAKKDENENENESEGEDEDEDKEKDKEKDDNENQKDDKDQQGDEEKENEDQKENNKDDKDQQSEDKNNDNKPREKKLSPQQIKNILEAMNQEESKVQEKMNAKKLKGVKLKNEKDW
ncbi:tetratricopeptide repeat protein [Flavobacteriaceae bacterium]|nr:tetratricopeptide repeat protein [Flavobacteriaceae bacterium]